MTCDPDLETRLRQTSHIRYIKLGEGGAWAARAFAEGIVPLKFEIVPHGPCAAGDWEAVGRLLEAAGRSTIADDLRELKAFYEFDESCLWFTMADGHIWWTFAELPVLAYDDNQQHSPVRYRRAIGGWRRVDVHGRPLLKRAFSSVLTRVGSYQRTICEVKGREAYLLSRIQGTELPLQAEVRQARSTLEGLAMRMIAQLHETDFEVMVDLILSRGGWQRQTAVGKGQTDHDLILTNPTTDEAAWVQVKSRADQGVLDDYLARYARDGSCQHFFFICHSPKASLVMPEGQRLHLWTGEGLARRAIGAGLVDWLMERSV